MSWKKVWITVLALVLTAGLLASCQPATGEPSGTSSQEQSQAQSQPQEKLKVGIVYISPKDDGGWSQAHSRGFEEAVAAIGADKVELNEIESIEDTDPAATETAIRTLIANGSEIIFATSWGYIDTVEMLADDFPDVKFEHCSGYKSADNFDNYFAQIEQARYLTGIIAGYATKTDKIGYVGAQPLAEVVRGLNAFTLGVRSVNPDAEVHVLFTGSWFNPEQEKANAEALIERGCDVMSQHQDSPSALIAAEEAGILGFGYDNPMGSFAPNAYLSAPIFNWGKYYETKIQAMIDGTWSVMQSWDGLETSVVELDTLSDKVPQEAKTKIDEIRPLLEEQGNAYFFTGPLKDNKGNDVLADGVALTKEEQFAMDWLVEGVVGELP